MLGLDAAGKTTILYKLHIGEILSTVPTVGALLARSFRVQGAEARSLTISACIAVLQCAHIRPCHPQPYGRRRSSFPVRCTP